MSAPVDVLAVKYGADICNGITAFWNPDWDRFSADLAKLIQAANNALCEIDGSGFFGPGNARIEDFRAALARIGGAA